MKICMVTNTYLPHVGGVARSVHQFSEDLRGLGHEVLVLAPEFSSGRSEAIEGVLRVPAFQNFNGSDFSVRIPIPFMIEDKIDSFYPDIIHSHHPFLMGDTALRIAHKRKLPLIFTHHTLYEQYTHYVPLDSYAMREFVIRLATRYANFCDRVVAPSRSISSLIQSRGVRRPVEEIPTGVDMDFFQKGNGQRFRASWALPQSALVLGHLGRLASEKNLVYLARAVINYLHRDPEAWFLLVGEGSIQEKIRRLFEEAGVAGRLVPAGKQTGRDLQDAYQAMDLFLFASKSETQGMVLTEAMAAGRPVIALDASGTREVVTDQENGRLLPEDASQETFADAIQEFARNPAKAEHWRHNSLKTAQRFSRGACTRKLEALYQRALQEYSSDSAVYSQDFGPLNSLIDRIKLEWDLLYEKTDAAMDALQSGKGSDSLGGRPSP